MEQRLSCEGMTPEEFVAAAYGGGKYQSAEWRTTVKPAAAHKARTLVKVTSATIRTGVDYANLAVNEGEQTGALPWGTWHTFPYVITHKEVLYGRVYAKADTIKSVYYVDGLEVDRDTFMGYLTPSQRNRKPPKGGTISPRFENLTLITRGE
jgi:hypothetical protein